MNTDTNSIIQILSTNRNAKYSRETVSQLERALQCAALVETSSATLELITVSLPYDFGHLGHI